MKISIETLINAPRQTVFDAALDVENWPATISAIEKVEFLTPGPVIVGTKIRETRIMFGRSASEDMTFDEITPHEKFVLTALSNGTAYRTEHLFSDVQGATRVKVTFEATPVTMAARLLMPIGILLAGSLRKMIAEDLADLKKTAEHATSQPA